MREWLKMSSQLCMFIVLSTKHAVKHPPSCLGTTSELFGFGSSHSERQYFLENNEHAQLDCYYNSEYLRTAFSCGSYKKLLTLNLTPFWDVEVCCLKENLPTFRTYLPHPSSGRCAQWGVSVVPVRPITLVPCPLCAFSKVRDSSRREGFLAHDKDPTLHTVLSYISGGWW